MILRGFFLTGVLLALFAASGCTVRPLMATDSTDGGKPATAFASIAVGQVGTRYAQEVRNHLIFLFYGGAAEPADPRYVLDLAVTSRVSTAASIQVEDDDEPTAEVVTLRANYRVVESGTDKVVAEGHREINSAYDLPRQEFAAMRAERDAHDRAARELAELIRLAVGQDLARLDDPA